MSKSSDIDELTTILSGALRHLIGFILGRDEYYQNKYKLEADARFILARNIAKNCHFNIYDKEVIKEKLNVKLKKELLVNEHISDKKYEIMDEEINKALSDLGIL